MLINGIFLLYVSTQRFAWTRPVTRTWRSRPTGKMPKIAVKRSSVQCALSWVRFAIKISTSKYKRKTYAALTSFAICEVICFTQSAFSLVLGLILEMEKVRTFDRVIHSSFLREI